MLFFVLDYYLVSIEFVQTIVCTIHNVQHCASGGTADPHAGLFGRGGLKRSILQYPKHLLILRFSHQSMKMIIDLIIPIKVGISFNTEVST